MTLRDSCNVRRLAILAGAFESRGSREGEGLYLRLGALTSLITLFFFLLLSYSCLYVYYRNPSSSNQQKPEIIQNDLGAYSLIWVHIHHYGIDYVFVCAYMYVYMNLLCWKHPHMSSTVGGVC